jgi:hypothetical protein
MTQTVWLFRVSGEGSHGERFCRNREEVADAYLALTIGGASGDPVVMEQNLREIEEYLQQFNNPHNWANGHFEWQVGETGRIDVFVIDPKSVAKLLNQVAETWLGI